MKKPVNVSDNYNYGLAILKVLMAFEVILCHYWSCNDTVNVPVYLKCFEELRLLAVPSFMIISFYFFMSSVITRDLSVFEKRIKKLLIPYIGWGVIYFMCYTLASIIFNIKITNGISDLGWQLLFGSSRNLDPPLWFQADLVFITVLIWIIFYFVTTETAFMIMFLLSVGSLYMQYSGINYMLFGNWEYETRYTCGRVFEMIPYAYIGMMFSYYRIESKLLSVKRYVFIANLSLFMLLWKFPIFSTLEMQFAYAGVSPICMTVLIVVTAMVISFEIVPSKVLEAVKWLSKYTLGVFCIHYGVGRGITMLLTKMEYRTNTFTHCIIIWIICYVIAYFISKMPIKFCKQLVK